MDWEAQKQRMLAQHESKRKTEAKELILQVIEEVSGHQRGPELL